MFPYEVILKIFSYLSVRERFRAHRICSLFRHLLIENEIITISAPNRVKPLNNVPYNLRHYLKNCRIILYGLAEPIPNNTVISIHIRWPSWDRLFVSNTNEPENKDSHLISLLLDQGLERIKIYSDNKVAGTLFFKPGRILVFWDLNTNISKLNEYLRNHGHTIISTEYTLNTHMINYHIKIISQQRRFYIIYNSVKMLRLFYPELDLNTIKPNALYHFTVTPSILTSSKEIYIYWNPKGTFPEIPKSDLDSIYFLYFRFDKKKIDWIPPMDRMGYVGCIGVNCSGGTVYGECQPLLASPGICEIQDDSF